MRKEQQAAQLERQILNQGRRLSDFDRFCRSYEAFREDCRLLEKNRQEKERILNLQKLKKERITGLEQALVTRGNQLTALERQAEVSRGRLAGYRQYSLLAEEDTGAGGTGSEAVEVMSKQAAKEAETRYEGIPPDMNRPGPLCRL